jgi:outer membrane lipoprotein-sorting protein
MILLLTSMLIFSACSSNKEKEAQQPQEVILEPGLIKKEPDTPAQPETSEQESPTTADDVFIDKDRASTLDDLMANKEKIQSYYYDFSITDDYGEMLIRVWYKDGLMKIVREFPDGDTEIEYFNCKNLTLVSHTPAFDDYGIMTTFEPGDPNMPKDHLSNDYHQFRLLDTESIDGQTCRVMENKDEKLWISTKYGFPLQREYSDPTTNEHVTAIFENITFNQVKYEEVVIPSDLLIYE